jgi:hypothetical protein
LIQVSENGGETWRLASVPPGLPTMAFINDIEASSHDSNTVMVVADDHKSGDYTPYLFESVDRGRTWRSIRGDLPDATIVWSIEQDHMKADLLFLGAEHGMHVSLDGGLHWHKLTKDVPTIAFRDLAIQRRDSDIVGATFGRGFYVLDDYSPLRELTEDALAQPATLFSVRDAWWYVPYRPMQAKGQPTLGSTAFRSPNPPFGATFTYHLSAEIRSLKSDRRANEKSLDDAKVDVGFPGWERLAEEHLDSGPIVLLVVRNELGEPVRTIGAECTAGLHRTTWDLRYPPPDPVSIEKPTFQPPWMSEPQGTLASPGEYTVELVHIASNQTKVLAGPQRFKVIPTAPVSGNADAEPTHAFRVRTSDLARRVAGAVKQIEATRNRILHLRAGMIATPAASGLLAKLDEVHRRLEALNVGINGDPVRERLAEPGHLSVRELVDRVAVHLVSTTGAPTQTQQSSIERAAAEFDPLRAELSALVEEDLARLVADFDDAGGPWTPR